MMVLSVNQGSDTKLAEFVANNKVLRLLAKSTILEIVSATFSFTTSQYCQRVAIFMNVILFFSHCIIRCVNGRQIYSVNKYVWKDQHVIHKITCE